MSVWWRRHHSPHPVRAPHGMDDLPLDPDLGFEDAGPRPTAPPPAADPDGRARRRSRTGHADIVAVIAVGGGLGSLARYALARAWPTPAGGFPWSTFTANVLGCLLLGLLTALAVEVWRPSRYLRPFLGIGVLGGFTTFSTYAVELRGFLSRHAWSTADAYALSSVAGGLAAVWTGVVLARRLAGLPIRRGPARRSDPAYGATLRLTPAVSGATRSDPGDGGAEGRADGEDADESAYSDGAR